MVFTSLLPVVGQEQDFFWLISMISDMTDSLSAASIS
jgi:hypothetical protein